MSFKALALALAGGGLWLLSRAKPTVPSVFAGTVAPAAPGFVEAVAAYDLLTAFTSSRAYSAEERASVDAALAVLRLALIRPASGVVAPPAPLPVAVST